MKERPIIFNAAAVKAILDGRKFAGKKMGLKRGTSPVDPIHLAHRLGKAVLINNGTGCWEWQQTKNSYGYGTLTVLGRSQFAHRLCFELASGEAAVGLFVCHRCDNPACINPDHLFLGTQADNMKDCALKGRIRNRPVSMPGERNPSSKLTVDQVIAIREMRTFGKTQRQIAEFFKISQSQVSAIVRWEAWKSQ